MVTNVQSPPTREDIALREVGHTDVRPGTVRFLLAFFFLALAVVPALEILSGRAAVSSGSVASWTHLTRLPAEVSGRLTSDAANAGGWTKLLVANRVVVQALVAFENALEDGSRLGQTLRPPTQALMTRWLGAGNEQAYVGRDRWLFYRPDVTYITNGPFLDPATLRRRVEAVDQWTSPPQPDPRKAIVSFKRALESRGIALIVVPTPLKPSIHPEKLDAGYADEPLPLQNPSYPALVEDLQREGVLVFDAAAVLAEAARASQATQYLAADTHWRPEAMEAVAERLVAFVRAQVALPDTAAGYRLEPREIRQLGDIAVMLDLPANQTLYPQETVTIRRVLGPDGTPWRPARTADVLLLGDSFSNIYSLPSLGWGDAAGLAEHVSYLLQRPVDRIVQNDQGAFATREMLRRGGADRLAGKRVVIYQFAARELMFGDWKVYE
jgi:alginate O-acetyltransferase complex protein AlgJ